MYLETTERPQGEAVKITKLSQAIRIGALTTPESTAWQGCALGTAAKAMGWNGDESWHEPTSWTIRRYLRPFNLDGDAFLAISRRHYRGEATRMEIAVELEMAGL